MTPEQWRRVKDLFEQALDLAPAEREALLDEARESPAIVAEVRNLIAGDARAGSFLQNGESLDSAEAPLFVPGDLVGGQYRIERLLGSGGMGEVWLAEQIAPVRRAVALKLIKGGMNSREVVARFGSERQALALMDHPSIAKVFDAGSTPDGAPYFVMEYVAGVPITAYCDHHRLSTRERLELFVRVCEGVRHAHQKAIIHRDLKPSNILVTEVDGRPAPKIIDFGVAKALTRKLTAETMFTRVGAVVGTPEYMSPEQANSAGEDIDTRTDVYALGVIFYELLAGVPPLELSQITFEEFLRRLREEEPRKPSTRIRTQDHDTSTDLACKRQTEPVTLAKQMRGDLDSIALKALEKDRSRRYGSASDLAADIERYLRNEAVLAVAPSFAYRARKFARRYRGALLTVCAFVLVLIAAAGISIWQSVRANREAAVAQAVNDFLQNDLLAQASATTQAGPNVKPDPHLEVRTALERAAARIGGRFSRQPEVEAAIRDTIGKTYTDLGLYREARTQLERALELQRRVLGAENPKTLKTLSRLGRVAELQGKYSEAEALERQAEESQRRVLSSKHPDTMYSETTLASVYNLEGKYAQAEALDGQVLETRRRLLGPEHPMTLSSMNDLALVYYREGKYAQAEVLYRQTLEIQRRVLGPEHPSSLGSMNNLGLVYGSEGKNAQAEALYRQALNIMLRVLGPEHPTTLVCMSNLAESYFSQGKYADAEALDTRTLEIRRRKLGPEHPNTLSSMNNLALVYRQEGKYAQAEALLNRTLEIKRRVLGPEHPNTLNTLSGLAHMYQRKGQYESAETYAAQALAGRRHALGSEHTDTMASAADLALAYVSQGKFSESEPLAREVLEFNRKKQPDDSQRFRAESLLGASLAGQKKYAEAEPLLLEGYQGMLARKDRMDVPEWYHLDRAREWLTQLYRAWGKPEPSSYSSANTTTARPK
jgi:eukaryotic-like serine/threonine-protein kinase